MYITYTERKFTCMNQKKQVIKSDETYLCEK